MIVLIIWEAVWLFALVWDIEKPLGVLFCLGMMLIPFLLIIINISRKGDSGLSKMDDAIMRDTDTSDVPKWGPYNNPFNAHAGNISSKRSHADWVKDSTVHDKECGKEYDHMWADEYLDEHDC